MTRILVLDVQRSSEPRTASLSKLLRRSLGLPLVGIVAAVIVVLIIGGIERR